MAQGQTREHQKGHILFSNHYTAGLTQWDYNRDT